MPSLINCETCKKEIAENAMSCPHCGAPNKKAVNRKRSNIQGGGCLITLLGLGLCFVAPMFGWIFIVIGLVILIVGLLS